MKPAIIIENERTFAEAADWLIRLNKCYSEDNRLEFLAWMRKSPAHVDAILRATAVMRECADRKTPRPRASESVRYLAAACFLVLSAIPALAFYWISNRPQKPVGAYVTSYDEPRTYDLGHASKMTLAAGSLAQGRAFDRGRGQEISLSYGGAIFAGVHDASYPLRVISGHTVIDVTGTEFEVRRDRDSKLTQVSVTAGQVRVSSTCESSIMAALINGDLTPAGLKSQAVLTKGRTASVQGDTCSGSLEVRATDNVVAPRRTSSPPEWVYFKDATVYDAVKVFNRYNARHMVVSDAATASQRIGGGFRPSDQTSFIEFLEHTYGVTVRDAVAADGTAVISLGGATQRSVD